MRDIAPLSIGVFVYGLAFGLLAAQAGMSSLDVGLMGSLVFAGSAQIVVVERLAAGAGAVAASIAGLALNLRLLLITASLRDVFAGRPRWQIALGAHLSTDENWALFMARRANGEPTGYPYLIGGGTSLILTWVSATMSGVWFANSIPQPQAFGMDFAFTAAFIAITRSLWRGRTDVLPWSVAVLTVALLMLTVVLDASWALVIGGLAGAATAGFGPDRS